MGSRDYARGAQKTSNDQKSVAYPTYSLAERAHSTFREVWFSSSVLVSLCITSTPSFLILAFLMAYRRTFKSLIAMWLFRLETERLATSTFGTIFKAASNAVAWPPSWQDLTIQPSTA
ncbi:uncharacterized protein BDR25DRAFT_360369 [Lindgomyces ingoldianus]|uniref:Uncharacterized protein n=1 Tax=Lindgomyces ingoldianus TaxID=673940 RepID=A0ACB6QFP3_9PLEO|nr:uncharacterized protein BDR25DRAFT_360369 [Lindgomyces ingoldianus]KAF2465398.1 hypothetical protein BDR25DRAFT_360369 [Lindgomyces ingoldianus]